MFDGVEFCILSGISTVRKKYKISLRQILINIKTGLKNHIDVEIGFWLLVMKINIVLLYRWLYN